LIGGPNQSHKVNFKEPPRRGKSSSKNFCVSSVNTYSGISENMLAEDQLLAALIRLTARFLPAAQESKGGRNMGLSWGSSRLFLTQKSYFLNNIWSRRLRIVFWTQKTDQLPPETLWVPGPLWGPGDSYPLINYNLRARARLAPGAAVFSQWVPMPPEPRHTPGSPISVGKHCSGARRPTL
jgi:hypothetical protein